MCQAENRMQSVLQNWWVFLPSLSSLPISESDEVLSYPPATSRPKGSQLCTGHSLSLMKSQDVLTQGTSMLRKVALIRC